MRNEKRWQRLHSRCGFCRRWRRFSSTLLYFVLVSEEIAHGEIRKGVAPPQVQELVDMAPVIF